jgi:hypothetical protein
MLLFLIIENMALAQTAQQKVVFEYDDSRNRKLRYIEEEEFPVPPPGSDSTITTTVDSAAATFSVSVYPNPVQDYMQIIIEPIADASDLSMVFNVRIVNTTSGVQYYQQTHHYTELVYINMSAYDTGFYQLLITRGAEVQSKNLLKQ